MTDIARQNLEQRLTALETANKVRSAGATLKKRMRRGELDPVAILRGQDDVWGRFADEVKLEPLLRSIPRFGRRTVHNIIVEVEVYPTTRLKNLPPHTRNRLADLVASIQGREDETVKRLEID